MFNFKFYLLPLLILSIGLSGCTKLNKDVSKTLSIVIEPAFKEQVLDAVKYATSKNNSLEFEIKILSPDPDKRSAEIQKLRTQIMSGKGPDLYLVNCSTDGAAQMNEPLFENPKAGTAFITHPAIYNRITGKFYSLRIQILRIGHMF